ncbi:MAG: HAD family hydrolase [Pseudomonadota bacterium]
MTAIRGILFDKDGTLFNFQESWAGWAEDMLEELAAGDVDLGDAMADAIGFDTAERGFRPSSPAIAGTPDEVADLLMPYLDGRFLRSSLIARLVESTIDAPMAPAAPLAPLLDRLADMGLVLGVATNDAEEPARAHLAAAGILDRFAFIAGHDSGFGAKPQPGQCAAFARATKMAPDDCVMVGDSRHDLLAGRGARFRTIGVLTGLAVRADLAPLADAVLPSIADLPGWLQGEAAGR